MLYDLFIQDLRNLDGKQKNELDLTNMPHLHQFYTDLIKTYNINRPFYLKEKSLQHRDLQGPEKKKIFSDINLVNYAENNEKIKQTETIWKDFLKIFNQIKKKELSVEKIKNETIDWLLNFAKIYDASHITPYLHCFANHFHEFVESYGCVNQFNLKLRKTKPFNSYTCIQGN